LCCGRIVANNVEEEVIFVQVKDPFIIILLTLTLAMQQISRYSMTQ